MNQIDIRSLLLNDEIMNRINQMKNKIPYDTEITLLLKKNDEMKNIDIIFENIKYKKFELHFTGKTLNSYLNTYYKPVLKETFYKIVDTSKIDYYSKIILYRNEKGNYILTLSNESGSLIIEEDIIRNQIDELIVKINEYLNNYINSFLENSIDNTKKQEIILHLQNFQKLFIIIGNYISIIGNIPNKQFAGYKKKLQKSKKTRKSKKNSRRTKKTRTRK
jgi:hypothetical protein